MPEMKVSALIRKHWRVCCASDDDQDSGITMRGINKILDDTDTLEAENKALREKLERYEHPVSLAPFNQGDIDELAAKP